MLILLKVLQLLLDGIIQSPKQLYTHSTSSNPGRITVGADGVYLINCTVGTNNSGANRVTINTAVYKNGSIVPGTESAITVEAMVMATP